MGRIYAGILGPLAMAVAFCRGVFGSGGVETTCSLAIGSLIVFAIVGALVGQFAQFTIDESVRSKLEQQLAGRTEIG